MEIYSKNKILDDYVLDGIKELLKNSSLSFDTTDIYKTDSTNQKTILYDNVSYIEDEKDDKKIIIGCGFRFQNVLKYIAVDERYKGENLSDKIISTLTSEAFFKGVHDLFLYTKPQSVNFFLGLGFNLIIETDTMAVMENKKDKLDQWINDIKNDTLKDERYKSILEDPTSKISAIVMNANPMSKGHKYLIEYAKNKSDFLYVFILSNDVSMFKTKDRYEIVKKECKDFDNVKVVQGGNYIISPATFPSYFLKDKTNINTSQMTLDAEIFSKLIAPSFHIKKRYVGTEPFSETTNAYNDILKKVLPKYNIELVEIERYNAISATKIRENISRYKATTDSGKKELILSDIKDMATNTAFEVIKNML
ncbi:MAG: [citrate (pro-3S)-lyase] ligase [Lachnospiraceae bacterium]|nr:[citrate (pro-3S)-lyase] ligase [Lachnospiraceae bacterium]